MKKGLNYGPKTTPKNITIEAELIQQLAVNYELTGAQIVSVIMHASLLAIEQEQHYLSKENILLGIKEEFSKEEKQFNVI